MHALWRDIALKIEQMARSHSSLWGWWTERLGPELQNFYGSMRPRQDQVAGPVKIRSGA
jgi:hypothetical protein